jgi:hypothetical protein
MIYVNPIYSQNAECLKVKPANAGCQHSAFYRAKEVALTVRFLQSPLRQTDTPASSQQRLSFPPE